MKKLFIYFRSAQSLVIFMFFLCSTLTELAAAVPPDFDSEGIEYIIKNDNIKLNSSPEKTSTSLQAVLSNTEESHTDPTISPEFEIDADIQTPSQLKTLRFISEHSTYIMVHFDFSRLPTDQSSKDLDIGNTVLKFSSFNDISENREKYKRLKVFLLKRGTLDFYVQEISILNLSAHPQAAKLTHSELKDWCDDFEVQEEQFFLLILDWNNLLWAVFSNDTQPVKLAKCPTYQWAKDDEFVFFKDHIPDAELDFLDDWFNYFEAHRRVEEKNPAIAKKENFFNIWKETPFDDLWQLEERNTLSPITKAAWYSLYSRSFTLLPELDHTCKDSEYVAAYFRELSRMNVMPGFITNDQDSKDWWFSYSRAYEIVTDSSDDPQQKITIEQLQQTVKQSLKPHRSLRPKEKLTYTDPITDLRCFFHATLGQSATPNIKAFAQQAIDDLIDDALLLSASEKDKQNFRKACLVETGKYRTQLNRPIKRKPETEKRILEKIREMNKPKKQRQGQVAQQ